MEHLALGLVLLAGTLVTSTLYQGHLSSIKEVALDMAPNSFDDQYQGCSHLMEEELAELNRTEFTINSIYAQAWALAAAEWRSRRSCVPPVLRPEQAIAILAYTLPGPLYQNFNAAVREAGRSRREYLDSFHFKVLHFLLSEALRALREAQPRRCYQVYRGVQDIRFTTQRGRTVRFGHFTSTSLRSQNTQQFGKDTFFSVCTCYGVPIKDFSIIAQEEEVLIPPFECFEVTNATWRDGNAYIQLYSKETFSNYNCEFIKGDVPTGWSGVQGGRWWEVAQSHQGKRASPLWGGRWGELALGLVSLH
ncbi:NARE ribosyltransferase, partial [Hemiprocne comata]|nr:NARE ribosyltransferase [Hemiprocne comata]